MIRRFFQWRAKRRIARNRYSIDRRIYTGRFKATFLSYLDGASFWETKKDKRLRRRSRRRKALIIVAFIGIILLIWGIISSIEGLMLFAVLSFCIN